MKKTEKAVHDLLTRMQNFLETHAHSLATVSRGNVRDELDEILRAIRHEHATRLGATMRGTGRTAILRGLREDLRICHIAPIVAVARSRVRGVPMVHALRLPRKGASTAELLMAATGIAPGVADCLELFRRQAFPDDFIEQLLAAANAVRAAEADVAHAQLEGVSATKSIAVLVRRGRDVARVLDALVRVNAAGNRSLLAEWRVIARVTPPQERKSALRGA